ncbi:COQ9-domain-containing protein [Lasiosphaeria miniovina]|uniref:Ubiquinone biosynthesis protein n=1 Tax=Lasiosphaeria miniovina TaxID=1954250 RepID=A0AA40DUG3_9PEZI|nr:COQ9-domain-containing protein [Lasiosphaeria miniovina]KAK0713827.1 COQ9-domain-containing protein [Lasiosphaeria miniovina]
MLPLSSPYPATAAARRTLVHHSISLLQSTGPFAATRSLSSSAGAPRPPRPLLSRARLCWTANGSGPAHHRFRAYHSYDHPAPAGPFNEAEEAILAAAYRQVPEHGFSPEALAIGAREAGYLDISTNLLADGPFSLIRWHLVKQREALAARKTVLFPDGATIDNKPVSVSAKVEALTWERLLGNVDIVGRWQEALAMMAQPSCVPASLKELATLADEILFLAGDVAVDSTWYTKRASLSAIYVGADLFMTTDQSPGFQHTHMFLRRRLTEATDVGNAAGSVREWISFTASAGINMLRSKGMRI